MIYSLTGKILKKTLDTVVISCAGVGYAVQVPLTTAESLPAPGREGTVYTVMNVTENDVSLYGFATEEQRSCFKMLTSVSGVGPKAGLAILSIMTPERVALAASSGDHKAFTKANGVGPKLAQRIALELKDKVGKGLADGTGFQVVMHQNKVAGGHAEVLAQLVGAHDAGQVLGQGVEQGGWRWGTTPRMLLRLWPALTKPCRCRILSKLHCAGFRVRKGVT